MAERTIALLRGINVGGHHKVPMAELRALLAEIGCTDVKTYIQSGNAVFDAPDRPDLEAALAAGMTERFGFSVPVVLRSAEELVEIYANNPFPTDGVDPRWLHVGFLSAEPEAARVAELDPDHWAPDRFRIVGSNLYLHYPNGTARSKMNTTWFDRRLGVTMTMRNWRTVGKLVALANP